MATTEYFCGGEKVPNFDLNHFATTLSSTLKILSSANSWVNLCILTVFSSEIPLMSQILKGEKPAKKKCWFHLPKECEMKVLLPSNFPLLGKSLFIPFSPPR